MRLFSLVKRRDYRLLMRGEAKSMALKKCPKCELNYIRGDAAYCDVCMRELRRDESVHIQQGPGEEETLCSECGEAPAVPGHDLCAGCLREQKRQTELEDADGIDEEFDDIEEEED